MALTGGSLERLVEMLRQVPSLADDATSFPIMTWEFGQTYEIEADTYDSSLTLTTIGEINLHWTFEDLHVFRAEYGNVVGPVGIEPTTFGLNVRRTPFPSVSVDRAQ